MDGPVSSMRKRRLGFFTSHLSSLTLLLTIPFDGFIRFPVNIWCLLCLIVLLHKWEVLMDLVRCLIEPRIHPQGYRSIKDSYGVKQDKIEGQ